MQGFLVVRCATSPFVRLVTSLVFLLKRQFPHCSAVVFIEQICNFIVFIDLPTNQDVFSIFDRQEPCHMLV